MAVGGTLNPYHGMAWEEQLLETKTKDKANN